MERNPLNFLIAADEFGRLILEKDWQQNDLGEPITWPQSLCSSLGIILNAAVPTLLFWGPKNHCFFNKEYLEILNHQKNFSEKLGLPGALVFSDNWRPINKIIENVLNALPINENKNYFIPEEKTGKASTNNWKFKYGALYNEAGAAAGVLVNISKINAVDPKQYDEQKIKEILERKDAESKAIIENAMFPIAVLKADDLEILAANEAIIKIWGKGKNVVGKKYMEILPELEAQQIFAKIKDVIETGVDFSANDQQLKFIKNGESAVEYFNYNFAALKDEHNHIYGILISAIDITEVTEARMKIENTVNELKLFKFMADNAADKLILIRRDASFAYVNNRVMHKWGYTKSEIKKLTVFDVDTLYNKKDFDKLFEKSFENKSIQFETSHKNKFGEVFPVEVSSTGLRLDGEAFIFVIARDISERKKTDIELRKAFTKIEASEKKFRESVKQAPLGIAIFRGENYVSELVNNDYYKLIDRTKEQFFNLPLFEALPEVKEVVEPIFIEIYKSGKAYHSYEFPVYLKKSKGMVLNYFNMVYHPLKDDSGNCNGIMVVAVDVTENAIAKRKLEESEKQFKSMIMQSPVAITILRGPDFIVETANKVMLEKIMGYKEEQVIGKPILTLFPELLEQQYAELLNNVFLKGENFNIEEALLIMNRGSVQVKMVLDISYTFMPAVDTTSAGIMVTANNVTDKVEARKNVELSSERLRLATEAANMGTFELDLESKLLIHSPQLAIVFGENPHKAINYETLRSKILLKDFDNIVRPAFDHAMQTGYYFYEARIIKSPGSLNWIRTQGKVVFDKQNTPLKIMGTTVDITESKLFTEELKKSEERFRLLANEIPQLIWTANKEGKFIYYNESVYKFSGLDKKELMSDGWLKIVHPDDREENVKLWTESITNGTDFLFEHRFKRFDDTYRWQLSRAVPQRSEHGEIQAWVGSSTDIQEIKEQEQQKDFFISMASHELKTPVTSIKGYVQILQSLYEKSEDVFLKNSLEVVDRQIITLTKLISELLDISKIKSDGLEITKEEVEIPELIREVAQQVMHTSPQYTIDLNLIPSLKLVADKDRIGQVLINLLTNAIKYAPNAKHIVVNCKLENEFVIISIKDEGIGISKLDQDKIFDRFYRVEGKDEKTYPGFGIGLFIASEIIKKHNGTMQVESELGKGSIFSFSLPLNN